MKGYKASTDESRDRREYRLKCRHLLLGEDICLLYTHHWPHGGITIGCTPDTRCPRMVRYGKRNGRTR